jgi:uncharacterized protein (TIGR03083 family)
MPAIPVPTIHLFPILEEKLIQLLHSLSAEEWNKPTIARLWTVKDVAAHLLDGNLRVLSIVRDNYFGDSPGNINTCDDLLQYLNKLNADFVTAMKRVSPGALLQLLETTGRQYSEQLAGLDPFAPAIFAVSWAGDTVSPNWFHIAREFTERWHHQQQIRDAVGKPGIMHRELYYPVLATFMLGLPHAYRNSMAAAGTLVKISITGEAGGSWWLIRQEDKWVLTTENSQPATAHCSIDGAVAWKLFTKSWRKKDMLHHFSIEGDASMAEPVLQMITVMA